MKLFLQFIVDGLKPSLRGGPLYWTWMLFLLALMCVTAWNYTDQWTHGLVITGLSDQVSWGFYIANFAFFVGIAAAAVLLVVPAYIFHRQDLKAVVLIGEGLAVAAVLVTMGFVSVDIGRPDRAWHVIPFIGRFNWPSSMLAWDIVVLNGYLLLNLAIPMNILFKHYQGKEPDIRRYFAFVVIAMFWAISIHTVTAFFVLFKYIPTGIWIEKGMGLVVTGFIPSPLGEIFEYTPTLQELGVSAGIYALGAFVFTILAKGGIAIELGHVRTGTRVVVPGKTLENGTIEIGSHRLRLIALDGHSDADLVILDETTGVLFAGDLVFHNRTPTAPHAIIANWLAALDKLAALEFKVLVPGRGPAVSNSAPITQTRDYLEWLNGSLAESAEQGLAMAEVLKPHCFLPLVTALPFVVELYLTSHRPAAGLEPRRWRP